MKIYKNAWKQNANMPQHLESKTALMCKKSPNNKRMKIKSYIGKRVLSRQRKSEIEVK